MHSVSSEVGDIQGGNAPLFSTSLERCPMLNPFVLEMLLVFPVSFGFAQARDQDEPKTIRAVISATYDQPGKSVRTDPVVVSGVHAVADWTQGSLGGRIGLSQNIDPAIIRSGDSIQ